MSKDIVQVGPLFRGRTKLAELFPPLEVISDAFKALVDDIKERGQQEPISLYEGKILDGRNRYKACQFLKRDAYVRDYTGNDPIGFVLSANLHRRHLNESQRAMIAAKLSDLGVGANQHTKEGTPIGVAAKLLSIGRGSIDRAHKVLNSGNPALVNEVEKGNVSVAAAAQQVTTKDAGKTGKGNARGSGKNASDAYDSAQKKLIEKLEALPLDDPDAAANETIKLLRSTVATMKKAVENAKAA